MGIRLSRVALGLWLGLTAGWLAAQAPQAPVTKAAPAPPHFPVGDHPQARADWFMRFRQSRDGESPAAHRLAAYRRAQAMPVVHPRRQRGAAESPAATGTSAPTELGGDWTELGPRPETDAQWGTVAGRLASIVVDLGADPSGNTVYLGAADGGLWKSTNALAANPVFTPIGDNLPSLAIGSIALDDSTTPTTIYVGTGEPNLSGDSYYGDGIFKSTDGGQTWTVGTGVDFTGSAVSRLLVDPTNPQVLLAAMTESGAYISDNDAISAPAIGILRSSDGGATWTSVRGGASATDLIYVPDPVTPAYYAAIRGAGVEQSIDQGMTWTVLGTPFGAAAVTSTDFYRASLAMRGGTLYALITDASGVPPTAQDCLNIGTCSGLVATSDGGNTWAALTTPTNLYGSNNQGNYDQYLAAPAAPAGTNLLVVGGIDVWSENLASPSPQWANLTNSYGSGTVHPDEHGIVCLDASHWYIANDGGAWYTANAGTAWSNLNETLGTIQFYSVTPDPVTPGRLLGGSQDNGTALGTGLGTSPGTWPEVWGGDGGHTAINPNNLQQLFTENYGYSLQRSDNGGANFNNAILASNTISDISEFYVPYELAPANPSTIYLVTQRVWKGPAVPTSPGQGWIAISPDLTHPQGNLDPSGDDLTVIAAAPSAADVVYVGAYDGSVSVTQNATAAQPTWNELPTTGDVIFSGPVSALAVSPADPNTVYWGLGFLGTSSVLNKSTDGGQTAVNVAGNLPGTPINAIVIDPANPDHIFIATDVGVFAAADGGVVGEHWARVGDNLPAAAVLSLALTQASGTEVLVAGTHGRGAWSIPAVVPPNFSLAVTPATQAVEAGQAAVYTIQTTAVGGGSSVTLDCGGDNACSINPAVVSAGGAATATVTTAAGDTDSNITINASNGFESFSETLGLSVLDYQFAFNVGGAPSTSQPAAVEIGKLVTLPFSVTLAAQKPSGGAAPTPFDVPIAFSCPDAPADITCTFTPGTMASLNGTVDGTLAVAAGAGAAQGPSAMTIQASGGTLTHTLTLNLTVNAFSIAATPASVTATAGTSAAFTVSSSSASNFAGPMALSCSMATGPQPTCAFQPATITAGQSSAVTITGFPDQGVNDVVTITATAGASVASTQVIIDSADFYVGVSNGISLVTLPGADMVNTAVIAGSSFGFSGPISLSCTSTAGLVCSFTPAIITANGQSSALAITGMASLPPSSLLPLQLVGTSGALQHSVAVPLSNDGDFTVNVSPPDTPVLPGGQATLVLQYEDLNNYQGGYTAVCGTPLGFDCSISSAGNVVTVSNLPATGPVTVPIIVTSTKDGATLSHTFEGQVQIGDFSFAATPPTVTVSAGQTANFALDFTVSSGATGYVLLTCSGLPAFASCPAPSPYYLTDGVPLAFPIQTAVTAGAASPGAPGSGGGGWWGGVGLLLLFGTLVSGRRRPALAAAMLFVLASVACGGGGGGAPPPASGSGGTITSSVTSTVTITATDATPGLTHPTSHSATVQLTIDN